MTPLEIINLVSNIVISTSCFLIAFLIARFLYLRRKDEIPFHTILILLTMLFFFAGGARYAMIVYPNPIIDAVARALIAITSLWVSVAILFSMERALKMKTPKQYDKIDKEKNELLHALRVEVEALKRQIVEHAR